MVECAVGRGEMTAAARTLVAELRGELDRVAVDVQAGGEAEVVDRVEFGDRTGEEVRLPCLDPGLAVQRRDHPAAAEGLNLYHGVVGDAPVDGSVRYPVVGDVVE